MPKSLVEEAKRRAWARAIPPKYRERFVAEVFRELEMPRVVSIRGPRPDPAQYIAAVQAFAEEIAEAA